MEYEYTMDNLLEDMELLRKAGLIEVIGVREDGEWLWGATEKSLNLTLDELKQIIESTEDEY